MDNLVAIRGVLNHRQSVRVHESLAALLDFPFVRRFQVLFDRLDGLRAELRLVT